MNLSCSNHSPSPTLFQEEGEGLREHFTKSLRNESVWGDTSAELGPDLNENYEVNITGRTLGLASRNLT